jgi:hypothetical protein
MEPTVTLTVREVQRQQVLEPLAASRLTVREAGELLEQSERQVRRPLPPVELQSVQVGERPGRVSRRP